MKLLRRTAMACLCVLIIAATLWVLGQVVARLVIVVVPVAVALLLAALLVPGVALLVKWGFPRALATLTVLLGGLAVIGAFLYFMVTAFIDGLPDLQSRLGESYTKLRTWLTDGLGVSGAQLDQMLEDGKTWFSENRSGLASGALGALTTAGTALAGLALVIFVLIFFLHDGNRMWRVMISPLSASTRPRADKAGRRAFRALTAYVRATVLVAFIDAVGIGLGLLVTGVPLVLPLSALVFFSAFVPVVGAFVSGLVAVAVALVSQGPVVALIIAGVVIVVQQLEGNVFEPLIMSKSVKLHPVAVILAVAVGVEVAGVLGALFAVPVLAVVRAVISSLRETSESREKQETGEKTGSGGPDADHPTRADQAKEDQATASSGL